MPTKEERPAFWGVVYGGFIALGATFVAVGLTLGIETLKAQGPEVQMFGQLFQQYLAIGLLTIGLTIYSAGRRFLGWGSTAPKKENDERPLER